MHRLARLSILGLLAASFGVTATSAGAQQSDDEWLSRCQRETGDRARACEVRPVAAPASGRIRVDARPNGGVAVAAGHDGAVSGSARLQAQADTEADARALLSQVQINVGADGISASGPRNDDGRSWSVSFVLSVPQHADLEILATNGPVSLAGISGRISATTVNGPVVVSDLGGEVRVRTTNGPLTVALGGRAWSGAGLDAEAQNGPVTLQVPDGYSAHLDVGTVNGPLSLGIPVTVQGELPTGRRSSIQTVLGAGGAPVRVHTVNGPASVRKR